MGLSEIAAEAGTITYGQRERRVGTVDATERPLVETLETVSDGLPCSGPAAATVVESYAAGASVGECAREAGLAPVTAAKTLHRLGVPGMSPLSPTAREVLEDWLAGRLTRRDALTLADASEAEFALATYVRTHEPLGAAVPRVDSILDEGAGKATDPGASPVGR